MFTKVYINIEMTSARSPRSSGATVLMRLLVLVNSLKNEVFWVSVIRERSVADFLNVA